MARSVCNVCGYVHERGATPGFYPTCKASAERFTKQEGEMSWAVEHAVGVAQDAPKNIMNDLRMNLGSECNKVGMYLAIACIAHREGHPEIGMYYEKAAYEEAEHVVKFTELLGEVTASPTKKNLEMRVDAGNGVTASKFDLARRARALDLDAIHDTVHEMACDGARHGKVSKGLLDCYFK